jgi:hypothetical protein
MPRIHRFVPVVVAALPLTLAILTGRSEVRGHEPRQPHARPIPIRHHIGTKVIEVPLTTWGLGWQPRPIRSIPAELIEERAGDDRDEFGVPVPPAGPARPAGKGTRSVSYLSPAKAECYDFWIYGYLSRERRTLWMLCMLSEKLARVGCHDWSDAEVEKLILAGRGDMKHLIDRIEAMRPDFEAVRYNDLACKKFLMGMVPLSGEFQRGPFGNGSLFAKTMAKIRADHEATGNARP